MKTRLPPLIHAQDRGVTQDAPGIRDAVRDLLEALLAPLAPARPARIALTAQRDALLAVGADGAPLGPLYSWMDGRGGGIAGLVEAVRSGRFEGPDRPAIRSLPAWLAEGWTGRAGETPATGGWMDDGRLAGFPRPPEQIPVGGIAGAFRGIPVHLTAGDKNCEFLGAGVDAPGIRGISLGTAISLGALLPAGPVSGVPAPLPRGVVRTRAACPGRWNVETGLPIGMAGMPARSDGGAGPERPEPMPIPGWRQERLRVPTVGGSFDGAVRRDGWFDAAGREFVPRPGDPAHPDLVQDWAQGVVAELRRLSPLLTLAGSPAPDHLLLTGGGASSGWGWLVAQAFDLPVHVVDDPWAGCRGAVRSALLASEPADEEEFSAGPRGSEPVRIEPDPGAAQATAHFLERWDRAFSLLSRSDG